MKYLQISKDQYLMDLIPEVPTNTIFYKTLTGIGATSLEISCQRNSLIIEPNVPVIIGKCKDNNKILGVYEGVTIDKVIEYLLSSIEHKKILVTPESIFKVKEAASVTGVNLHEEFFLFFDECDRTIKDAGFRKKIILPMDDFFAFKKKAFISATPLEPSDPRFIEQTFQRIEIKPDFDYRKDIDVVLTNNVFLSLKKLLTENPDENYCIFLNSTGLIASYIKTLEIQPRCRVFCSREASYSFQYNHIKASDNLKEFQQVNFFTSRFYSAVDIYMDVKPTVIMLTDVINVGHTIIDPKTDAVQIVGRFRTGVKKIIHITNVDAEIQSMNKDEVVAYLNGCERSYGDIRALRNSATEKGSIDTLSEALELVPYANYVNEDGSKNYYMIDNTVHEERIKGCYQNSEKLIEAYQDSGHFSPSLFTEAFPLSDIDNLKLSSGNSFKNMVEVIVNTLGIIFEQRSTFSFNNDQAVLAELNKAFPVVMHAYQELGKEDLLKNSYSKKQLEKHLKEKKREKEKSHFGFLKTLQEDFPTGITLSSAEIRRRLDVAIKQHGLSLSPDIKLLEDFCELSPRRTIERTPEGREIKGFTIRRSKFNI